jgi:hypothetical protein
LVLQNTNLVNGFIEATLNDTISLSNFRRTEYDKKPFGGLQSTTFTAEKYQLFMMKLDYIVFGITKFKVVDNRLFATNNLSNGVTHFITITEQQQSNLNELPVCFLITDEFYVICGICGKTSCPLSQLLISTTSVSCEEAPSTGAGGVPIGIGLGSTGPSGNNTSGNTNPGTVPNPPDSLNNPCDSVNSIAKNIGFRNLFQNLKNQVPTRKENMYIIPNDLSQTPQLYTGLENEFGFSTLPPDSAFVGKRGWLHNHFADADSAGLTFSGMDVVDFATLLNDTSNFHLDYKNCMIGMVGDSSTQYILMVKDINEFRIWSTFFANEYAIETLYTVNNLSLKNLPLSVKETELRFLKTFKNSGFQLYRGSNDFKKWTPIQLNLAETAVINSPHCSN